MDYRKSKFKFVLCLKPERLYFQSLDTSITFSLKSISSEIISFATLIVAKAI